jgi:hypothetical protein
MADEPVAAAATDTPAPEVAATPNLVADVAAGAEAPAVVAEPEKPTAPVVPEAYEYVPPDGMKVDPASLEPFNAHAKELGLSQEQYKGLVDFALARDANNAAAPAKAWEALQTQWRGEVMADTSISDGKGLTPEASEAVVRVLSQFGQDGSLKQALAITGAGNNPAIVKAFVAIGKAMGAAGPLGFGKPASTLPKGNDFDSVAARLYPQAQGAQ